MSGRGRTGRVSLVGAGPGDPELLTFAAHRALVEADLVVADRLIPPAILALVSGDLYVAPKQPGCADEAQEEIERRVIDAARSGLDVVRLKAGDPAIFGRTGEELAVFARAGLTTRVIPGISSVTAASAAAQIPLTLRGVADRVTVITGHGAAGRHAALPRFDPDVTLVLLMAVARAGEIATGLVTRGWPRTTPVAIIERASQPDERVTRTPLGSLGTAVVREQVRSPAVIVVGAVAAFSVASTAILPRSPRVLSGVA
ncbi:MAG: uroporphyrinogen-III C-methyltransferase [Deltaproteobacteria bacterium]|nr:uroporphyrinogen-III C-methyltransferase [Deltaproteobacteria bacterium]